MANLQKALYANTQAKNFFFGDDGMKFSAAGGDDAVRGFKEIPQHLGLFIIRQKPWGMQPFPADRHCWMEL